MLDASFKFEIQNEFFKRNAPYNLLLKMDSDWKQSKRRLLIVFQSVDSRDLPSERTGKEGELLGDVGTFTAFRNAYKYARKTAQTYLRGTDKTVPEYALAVANFNAARHLHMSSRGRHDAELVFADRLRQMIRKLRPTHVLFSGDEALSVTYPQIAYGHYKRGWIHTLKEDDFSFKAASTLDFARLLDKNGALANLLGFWTRHLAQLLIEHNPFSLAHVKAEPRFIKTIDQFDKLMKRFDTAEYCALDTETKNLSSLHNRIYTMQFTTNHNPNAGYVLAIDHPLTHWSKEERQYIKRELRQRFAAKTGPLLITFNGHMFDLRVIRQILRIPIMWLPVWEIMFAEHSLDENASLLNAASNAVNPDGKKATYGGLAPIFTSYGNDHYYTAAFSKAQRSTSGQVKPDNPDFLEYASTDTVSIAHIRQMQIKRASYMEIDGQSFAPYFVRHMKQQMSDTAHALSHMRNDGSSLSRPALKHLMGPKSPLREMMAKTLDQLLSLIHI